MQPAPIPPNGIATWVALSPLKVRCSPGSKRSAEELGFDWSGESGGTSGGSEFVCPMAVAAAATNADEEPVIKNSLRLCCFENGIDSPETDGFSVAMPQQ
jgi:hypothetical protein